MSETPIKRVFRWIRIGVSVTVLVVIGLVAVVAGYLYLTRSEAPDWLIRPVARLVETRARVQLAVDSVRIGPAARLCDPGFDIAGVHLEFGDPANRARFSVGRIGWNGTVASIEGFQAEIPGDKGATVAELARAEFGGGEFEASGLRVGPQAAGSGLAVESVRAAPRTSGVRIRGLTQTPEPLSSGMRIVVAEVDISPVESEGQPAAVTISDVAVRQVNFQSPFQQDAPPVCERLAGVFDPLERTCDGVRGGMDRIHAGLASARRWLRIIVIAAIAGFFLLKLVPAWDARSWWSRLALAGATVALPSVSYVLGRERSGSLPLVCIGLACASVMAAALYFGAYRHFSGWYHKGAAVALDLAGAVILPLFLLNGLVRSLEFQLPSGLRVERMEVEGINGELETVTCDGLNRVRVNNARLEIEGVDAPFSRLLDGKPAIEISRIAFDAPAGDVDPAVLIENPSGREVLQLPELSAGVQNIHASLDVERRRYESIGARLHASGSVESRSVRERVRRIRFLRNRATELSAARFAVAANAAGPRSEPPEREGAAGPDAGAAHFSVDAAIGLDVARCALPIDADLGIHTRDVRAAASLELRGEKVDVRNVRSLAGSRLTFRGGTAHATIGDRVEVNGGIRDVGAKSESSEFGVGSAKFDLSAPVGCSPSGAQTLTAMLAGIGFKSANGLAAGLERASFALDRQIGRAAGKIGASAELHALTLSATSQPAEGGSPTVPWLTTDIPYAKFALAGSASGETLPRRIDGTADILISRSASQPRQPENLAFRMDEPMRFSANLQAPEIDLPQQHNTFRQSIASNALVPAPLDFSFHAAAGINGAPAEIRAHVLSDWISFTPPSLPRHFQVNEISKLTLGSSGALQGLPLGEDLFRFDDLPPLCRESIDLELNPFRVEARWSGSDRTPLIRVQGKTGSEIRIRLSEGGSSTEIGDSGLAIRTGAIDRRTRTISAPNARIEALDIGLAVRNIQPGGNAGGRGLTLSADIARTAGSLELSSGLATGDGQGLFAFGFDRTGGQINFALRDELEVNRLVGAINPFLQPLQCDLSWITPNVRVQKFAGEAMLSGGRLASAHVNAAIAPGSNLALDLDAAARGGNGNPPAHLRKIDIAVDPNNPLNIDVYAGKIASSRGDLDLAISGNLPLKLDAFGRKAEHHQATVVLRTEAAGALLTVEPAASPIVARGRKVFSDLRRHVTNSTRVFGNPENDGSSRPLDLRWDLALRDSPAAKPLEIRKGGSENESDEVRSALAIDRATFAWKRAGQAEESRFKSSGTLAAASRLHRGYLILEADSTLALNFLLDSQPGCSFNFQTPFAAAFRDELDLAPSGQDSLWDAAAYDGLWTSYKPAFPSRAFEPLLNCRSLISGNLSILQAAFPANVPRIAVGHGDHLQLNIPFAGSMLFGTADGLLQADIEWRDDHAVVSSAGKLALLNFHAAALGRQAIPGHLSFVEDELNAKVNLLARGIAVGRDGIPTQPANLFEAAEYPPFDLDLTLSRARPDEALPGVLQATNRINLKLMNEFLENVLAGVRLPAPPTALRYQGLDLNLAVKNGIIQTGPMLLNLRGVRLFSSEPIEVGGDIRVHWKRDGWTLPEYKFSDFVSSMQRFASAAPAE